MSPPSHYHTSAQLSASATLILKLPAESKAGDEELGKAGVGGGVCFGG